MKLVDDNDAPDMLLAFYLRTFAQKFRDFRKAGGVLECDSRTGGPATP